MRRSARLLLTLTLSTVTALILLAAALTIGPDAPVSRTSVAANERLVVRFYTAINGAIATGDTTPLDALLAPDFVEGAPLPGSGTDRNRLTSLLLRLHHTQPQFRLVVEEVIANADTAFAAVQADPPAQDAFLGVPVASDGGIWGPTDGFQIAEGRITAHWNDRAGVVLAEPLLDLSLPALPSAETSVELVRLTLAPGVSSVTPLAPGPTLYVGESGTLFVDTGRAESHENPGGAFGAVAPGEAVLIPPGTRHVLTTAADEGAVVLMVGLGWQGAIVVKPLARTRGVGHDRTAGSCVPPDLCGGGGRVAAGHDADGSLYPASRPGLSDTASHLVVRTLARGTVGPWPTEPDRVTLGWLTLGPGASLAPPAGSQLVIAVEAGEPHLATDVTGPAGSPQPRRVTAAPGEAAVVSPEETAVLRNQGDRPLRVLVLTLSAEDARKP